MAANSQRSLQSGPTGVLYEYFHAWDLTPLRVTMIYLTLGFTALYVSDVWLVQQLSDPLLAQIQAVKAGVEVLATGGLIFGLLVAKERQVGRKQSQLDRQREELLVLHRVLRHNLRNDLNIILGWGKQVIHEATADPVSEHCERIYATAAKMLNYTEQAERIRRVTEQNGHRVVVDLGERVPELIDEHSKITDDVEVTLDCPETAVVRVNGMFEEALEELLSNAVTHNYADPPRLDVSVEPATDSARTVEVVVADNGPGLPADVIQVLRGSEYDQMTHLQGMGLWFVTWVVAESRGQIWFEETADGGASVRLQVPKEAIRLSRSLG